MIKLNKPTCPNPKALKTNYKHADNKSALMQASSEKCIYCESKVTHVYFGDVEHIKPKSVYKDLEFDWDNLGVVCAHCNNAKKDIYDESCAPINPYVEDPSQYIQPFGNWIRPKDGSERGRMTIQLIDLNRTQLLLRRHDHIIDIENAIYAMRNDNPTLKRLLLTNLKRMANTDQEFSMITKALFELDNIL